MHHLLFIMLLGGGGQAGLPWTERDKAVHDCFHTPSDEADTLIAGCTKLIALGWNLDSKSYSVILVNMGVARWKKKQLDKAVEDFDSAARMNPRLMPAFLNRASIKISLGKADQALPDLDYVLTQEAGQPTALNLRCRARGELNENLVGALADCDQSLKVRPGYDDTLRNRAFVLYRMGKYEEALAGCNAALTANSAFSDTLLVRGYVKRKLGDTAGGEADIAAAIAQDSSAEADFQKRALGTSATK